MIEHICIATSALVLALPASAGVAVHLREVRGPRGRVRVQHLSAEYDDPDTGERVYDYCDGIMRVRERATRYVWSERPGECGTALA